MRKGEQYKCATDLRPLLICSFPQSHECPPVRCFTALEFSLSWENGGLTLLFNVLDRHLDVLIDAIS